MAFVVAIANDDDDATPPARFWNQHNCKSNLSTESLMQLQKYQRQKEDKDFISAAKVCLSDWLTARSELQSQISRRTTGPANMGLVSLSLSAISLDPTR